MTIGTHVDIRINDANIANDHIYLCSRLDFFPSAAVGGNNYESASDQKLAIKFVPGKFVETDIDGNHKFLRCRSEIREFFELAKALEDDVVRVTRLGEFAYVFEVIKK